MHRFVAITYLVSILGACSTTDSGPKGDGGGDGTDGGTDDHTTGPQSGGESGGGEDDSDGAGDEADTDTDDGRPDGPSPDAGDPAPEQCQAIDVVLVVDNSNSMEAEQAILAREGDAILEGIVQATGTTDYHVMVVSADGDTTGAPYPTEPGCAEGNCVCGPTADCCESACEDPGVQSCQGLPCALIDNAEACDVTYGAGRRFSNQADVCGLATEARYLTSATPDPVGVLSCLTQVGAYGTGNELPIGAALASVTEDLTRPDGCNEGFLRQDALLVLVFVTDEEDNGKSPGEPELWHNTLVALKGGRQEAVVVLGIFGDADLPTGECAPLLDDAGAEPAPRLRRFVESFGHQGIAASICAETYEPAFMELADVVDDACEDLVREQR